jgi:hypothetical protein
MGSGTQFSWQHDAQQLSDRVLTLFDNGTDGPVKTESHSRGVALDLDESRRKVTLQTAYTSSHRLVAGAMGSLQTLASGHVVVGWGVASYTSQFAADGTLLSEFALPPGMYSYRGLWLPWTAVPHHRPEVAARPDQQRGTILYASWNGATEVAGWEVRAGSSSDRLRPLGVATRRGFETVIPMQSEHRYASVAALDGRGRRLKHSRVIEL